MPVPAGRLRPNGDNVQGLGVMRAKRLGRGFVEQARGQHWLLNASAPTPALGCAGMAQTTPSASMGTTLNEADAK